MVINLVLYVVMFVACYSFVTMGYIYVRATLRHRRGESVDPQLRDPSHLALNQLFLGVPMIVCFVLLYKRGFGGSAIIVYSAAGLLGLLWGHIRSTKLLAGKE